MFRLSNLVQSELDLLSYESYFITFFLLSKVCVVNIKYSYFYHQYNLSLIYIYDYLLVYHLNQPTNRAKPTACASVEGRARPHPHASVESHAPTHRSKPVHLTEPIGSARFDRADETPIEPTDLTSTRSHVTQSFFRCRSVILQYRQPFCYNELSHLLN
jgi:hypothetical protein